MSRETWDEASVRDLAERRRRAGTQLGISHADTPPRPDPAEDPGVEPAGSGFLVRLNGKQVSIVLGIAVTLAGGVVAVWTREPGKGDVAHASSLRAEAAITTEVLEKALASSPKYQLDQRRVDELSAGFAEVRGQVKFLYDEALKRQGAQEERQRRRKETQ